MCGKEPEASPSLQNRTGSLGQSERKRQKKYPAPDKTRQRTQRLRQVLINLLGNAMKFTKEGGVTVRVRKTSEVSTLKTSKTSEVSLKTKTSEVFLTFEVEDTGPGIAPDELSNLFEPFVQTGTGQKSHEGTGLGLAISKRFVRLMGGEIRAESEAGRGTTFTFRIRAGMADASDIETGKPARQVITPEPNQPRYRILIADDKDDNRRLIFNLLNPLNFELREAENGREAVETWKKWHPHLIWMDIRMPMMDGREAVKVIRGLETEKSGISHQTSAIIIAVTASGFEEDRAAALAAGCDDFLCKPFHENAVYDLMTKHIGVRFVYEEGPETVPPGEEKADKEVLTPERLNALPREWLADLMTAAIRTDPKRSDAVIDRIREHDEPLADALSDLVGKYRFDIIQELLK
ncbi:ATP-binding protein [Desulfococcaceae bacterium HSG8]|nr:ATP-binding protein [Desulfococcaceae bacterium HSG8]